jgi:hypothetical protein
MNTLDRVVGLDLRKFGVTAWPAASPSPAAGSGTTAYRNTPAGSRGSATASSVVWPARRLSPLKGPSQRLLRRKAQQRPIPRTGPPGGLPQRWTALVDH